MSRVVMGFVAVSKAEISPQHLRSRSEISPCHTAPECHSGSFAPSFSASAASFLFPGECLPAFRGARDIAEAEEQLTDLI